MDVGDQVGRCEGRVAVLVGIKGREEGWSLLNDANPSVGVAMDVALVALGYTEGAFEVEIVHGEFSAVLAGEQAGRERAHQPTHVGAYRIGTLDVDSGQCLELFTTTRARTVFWRKQFPNDFQLAFVLLDGAQLLSDQRSTSIDAASEAT